MKNEVTHNRLGNIVYEENFFNGKKSLIVNGNVLHQNLLLNISFVK